MKNKATLALISLSLLITFSACESGDEANIKTDPSPETLIQATKLLTRPFGDLKGFIGASGLDVDLSAMKYNVELYKVEYTTLYKNEPITASAMMIIPVTTEEVSTATFFHGTIASDAEAPSNSGAGNGQIILGSAIASAGLVVVMPDFIGFGSSVDIMHPYYLEDITATSMIDAIYASRQLADNEGLKLDGELYLSGYSQGGFVTMATHKHIEEKGIDFFDLKASFPSSGGYDIKAFQDYFFSLETYDQPFFLAFVANAYKVTLDWSQPLSFFFKEPYATEIPGYFDGSLNGSEINGNLTTTLGDYLNPSFLNGANSPDYEFVREAFVDNSPIDFIPKVRMFMYHGDADITVPYQNSLDVYNHFIESGAAAEVVTFTTLPGGTHMTGVGPYIENLVHELQEFEK